MSSVLTVSAELGTVLEVLLDVIPSLEDVSLLTFSVTLSNQTLGTFKVHISQCFILIFI